MENKGERGKAFLYELRDLFSGAAFPLMLQAIISVTFIGMTTSLIGSDLVLTIILLVIGELFIAAAYIIFGRQSGVTSVRRILNHAKKLEIGSTDKQAVYGTGEYSACKGFVMGFISCIPYIIFQIIQCAAPNSVCDFVLNYVFAWAAIPLSLAHLSPWLNLLTVLYPVVVHGVAYIVFAHKEWNKLQDMQEKQRAAEGKK